MSFWLWNLNETALYVCAYVYVVVSLGGKQFLCFGMTSRFAVNWHTIAVVTVEIRVSGQRTVFVADDSKIRLERVE